MAKLLCRVLCALLFVAWTEESQNLLYEGHWKSPFAVLKPLVTALPIVRLSPWQLLLIALAPVCLLWPGARQRRSLVMDAAIGVSLASIALGFAWGMAGGGSGYQAYFQLNAFLAALLVAALLPAVTRTPRDLRAIGLTVLAAGLVRSTLVLYFYFFQVKGRIFPAPSYMTTHEDSLLFVASILIVLSWALARRSGSSWWLAFWVSAYLLWAMALNGRRLAWLELLLGLGFVYLQLPRGRQRRRVNRALLAAAPLLLLYALAGWGRTEAIFEPLRAFSSAGSDSDNSSLARLEEARNLLYTLSNVGNPALGVGWGQPYHKVTSVYANFDESWSQYLYMPHNSLLGMAAFSGLVGLFGMWMVVPVAAFLGTRGYRGARRPTERAAAMATVAILPAFGAQCYGDIGLKQIASTLVLGTVMAVAATTGNRSRVATRANASRPRARPWPASAEPGPRPPSRGRPAPARAATG